MEATVGGEQKKMVTGVSVQKCSTFCGIMTQLLAEADNGDFRTKAQAVHRRDELVHEANRLRAEVCVGTVPADPLESGLDVN